MLQLEKRFYSREEIAEILSVNINDYDHFARNVKDKLKKWGYGCAYKEGVTITYVPTTAEERLAEIAIRQFKLDVQSNPYAFACFITAFTDVEGFDSMPWGERENAYFSYSGIFVGERTLRNWCSKLMKQNAIAKVGGSTYWKTEFVNGIKVRTQVQREDTIAYYNRRTEIIQQETGKNVLAGMTRKDAYKAAWSAAYPILWGELSCCYYCCKGFLLTAFSNNDAMFELLELTRQISGKEERLSL